MTATTPTKRASAQGAVAGIKLRLDETSAIISVFVVDAKTGRHWCSLPVGAGAWHSPELREREDGVQFGRELVRRWNSFAAAPEPAVPPPSPVRIKALDWRRVTYGWLAFEEWYRIEDNGSNWTTERYWLYERGEQLGKFDTLADAQAAMQVKHEARIRASLASDATANSKAGDEDVQGAWRDVLAERRRQISDEGWTPYHDDTHDKGEMAKAAACYAAGTTFERTLSPEERRNLRTKQTHSKGIWPWDKRWWKPSTRRRDLVKAGALIIAEIERIDRARTLATPETEKING